MRQVQVYCLFRGHTGTVWFDDVSLARAAEPDRNLLRGGDFEPAAPRAQAEARRQAAERLATIGEEVAALTAAGAMPAPDRLATLADSAQANLDWVRSLLLGTAAVQRATRDWRDVLALLQ